MLVLDPAWMQATALLWLRLSALLLLTPLFTLFRGPTVFKVVFTLALAGTLAAGLGATAAQPLRDPLAWIFAALSEVLAGAVLAFGIHAAFGALHLVSRLLDLQIGFGMGGVFDPATRGGQTSALGMGLQLMGVVTFFSLGAHHAMLRGVAFSIDKLPLGVPFTSYPPAAIVAQFGAMFSLALVIGVPVVFALLLLEGGLAVVSRALPQMHVFFVAMPIKLLLGLALLALLMRQLTPVLGRVYAGVFTYWERVLP